MAIVITKLGNRYHKVEQSLLQKGVIVIINGGNFYYKVGRSLLQSAAIVITDYR